MALSLAGNSAKAGEGGPLGSLAPFRKIQAWLDRILVEKEKMDCRHIRASARFGCACRRCKAARSIG
jgi:hypothetical protein